MTSSLFYLNKDFFRCTPKSFTEQPALPPPAQAHAQAQAQAHELWAHELWLPLPLDMKLLRLLGTFITFTWIKVFGSPVYL